METLPQKATEVKVRAQHILHKETEIREVMIIIDMNRFEEVSKEIPLYHGVRSDLSQRCHPSRQKRNTVHPEFPAVLRISCVDTISMVVPQKNAGSILLTASTVAVP